MSGTAELAPARERGVALFRGGAGAAVARRLLAVAERELFLLLVLCFAAALLVVRMGGTLANDGWLALVSGREIAENGLPQIDTLTVWARGVEWVDQQWLSQLAIYRLFEVGGIELALFANVAALVGGLALVLAAARHAGASSRNAAAVGALCLFVSLPSTAVRAQTLAYPLFAALLWLLAADARRPSRRVLLCVPLLVVWANVHGSVVVGAAAVALAGVAFAAAEVLRSKRLPRAVAIRAAALVLAPWPCLVASPYGASLVDYYRSTVGNPDFQTLVTEWQASTYPDQLPFFVLLLGALWLVARYGDRLTLFERLVVLGTAAGGIVAVRNVVWFALAVAAVAPAALERAWPVRADQRRNVRLNLALLAAALAAVAVFVGLAAARPASSYQETFPAGAAEMVAQVAGENPGVKIYANERYANWLMWREPQLRGRIAYDARFELLTTAQLKALFEFRNRIGAGWRRAAAGYGVVVLDVVSEGEVEKALLSTERTTWRAYRDQHVAVLVRGRLLR